MKSMYMNMNARQKPYSNHKSNDTKNSYHFSLLTANDDGYNNGKSKEHRGYHFRIVKTFAISFCHFVNIYGAIVLSLFILSLFNALYVIYFELGMQGIFQMSNNGPICSRMMGNRETEVVELLNSYDENEKNHVESNKRYLSNLSSQEFYDSYIRTRKVVHIKNAYDNETLSRNRDLLSDENLLRELSRTRLSVEKELKETRNEGVDEKMSIESFVTEYKKPGVEMYAILSLTEELSRKQREFLKDLRVLRLFEDFIKSSDSEELQPLVWWSPGKTSSVIHLDAYHNFESIFYGSKTFFISDISHVDDLGFPNNANDYKNESSMIDFQSIYNNENSEAEEILHQFPGFKDIKWHRVDLLPGDVLFIPEWTPHYVQTPDARKEKDKKSLALNFFWTEPTWKGSMEEEDADKEQIGSILGFNYCLRSSTLSLSINTSVLQQPPDGWTFVNTVASGMLASVLFFVKIIRVCKNFWMDIILNKSVTFQMETESARNFTASIPLKAHQYCREYYPYKSFNGKDSTNKNLYVNLTESLLHPDAKCTNQPPPTSPSYKTDRSTKKYNNCACDIPMGHITLIELAIMMITISTVPFFGPLSSRYIYKNDNIFVYGIHKSTIITTAIMILFLLFQFHCIT